MEYIASTFLVHLSTTMTWSEYMVMLSLKIARTLCILNGLNEFLIYINYIIQYTYNTPLTLFVVKHGVHASKKTSTTFITEESFKYNDK